MIKYLHGRISAEQWLQEPRPGYPSGILLRKSRGSYICEPEDIDNCLLSAVVKMNVEIAFTMSTEKTQGVLSTLQHGQTEIILANGSQLQVLDSLADITSSANVKKLQYMALIRKEQMLLVWHDDLEKIITHAASIEEKLLALVC
jgi:ERCC4-type nuclease